MSQDRQGPRIMVSAVDTESANADQQMIARQRPRVSRRALTFIGALGLVGLAIAGCASDSSNALGGKGPYGVAPPGGSAVNGLLDEWHVRADASNVHAGPVTFTVSNTGTIIHEMLVTRTDIEPGKIPSRKDPS